jgi:hypothetical protein
MMHGREGEEEKLKAMRREGGRGEAAEGSSKKTEAEQWDAGTGWEAC